MPLQGLCALACQRGYLVSQSRCGLQKAIFRTAQATRYFQQDHLGSIAVITDEAGAVVERLAYDPWGCSGISKMQLLASCPAKRLSACTRDGYQRRNSNGLADTQDSIVGLTLDRGFTEHEHLDEVGVIHMNGRIYDPLMGRFMSADPFIQAPFELQSHNRYSYVMNNPLFYTDPSGYSWLGSVFQGVTGSSWSSARDNVVKPAIVIYAAYVTGGWAANAMGYGGATYGAAMTAATSGGFTSAVAVGAASGFAAGFTATTLYGGNFEQAFQAGTTGALVGGAMGAVGFASSGFDLGGRVASKVVASGALAKAQGGSFADAVRRTLLTSTAAEVYTRFVGWSATAEGGANPPNPQAGCDSAGASCYEYVDEKIPQTREGTNVVGLNKPMTSNDSWYSGKQGSPLTKFFNSLPGVNATAMFHDQLWPPSMNPYFNLFTNVLSMVPAAAISYGALIDKVPSLDRSRCPKCR